MNVNPLLPSGYDVSFFVIIGILVLFSSVMKGFALYRAGTRKELGWFVAMFILNTAGILELLYLLVFSKRDKK